MTSNEREYLELQGRMIEVSEQIAAIKGQLSIAKARCARSKDFSDSQWFHSANHVLKQKQIEKQKLQNESGILKKKIKEENRTNVKEDTVTFERAFMHEAKSFLDHAVYVELLRRTERTVEAACQTA